MDISPLTTGVDAMSRISSAIRSSASSTGMPAASSGVEALKTRLAASASENGATAVATCAAWARR